MTWTILLSPTLRAARYRAPSPEGRRFAQNDYIPPSRGSESRVRSVSLLMPGSDHFTSASKDEGVFDTSEDADNDFEYEDDQRDLPGLATSRGRTGPSTLIPRPAARNAPAPIPLARRNA